MTIKTILGNILIVISYIGAFAIVVTIPKAFLETATSFTESAGYGLGYLIGTLFGYLIVAVLFYFIHHFGVKLKTKKLD